MVHKNAGRRGRVTLGDVFEFPTSRGLAYFQFVNQDPLMGELIRILPGTHRERPRLEALAGERELYYVYFPVTASFRFKIIANVGTFPIPIWAQGIPVMKRPAARGKDRTVLTWFIVGGGQKQRVHQLNDEQKCYSLSVVWNLEYLKARLEEGWLPGQERET